MRGEEEGISSLARYVRELYSLCFLPDWGATAAFYPYPRPFIPIPMLIALGTHTTKRSIDLCACVCVCDPLDLVVIILPVPLTRATNWYTRTRTHSPLGHLLCRHYYPLQPIALPTALSYLTLAFSYRQYRQYRKAHQGPPEAMIRLICFQVPICRYRPVARQCKLVEMRFVRSGRFVQPNRC